MYAYTFNTGDHKAAFALEVTKLVANDIENISAKNAAVKALTDTYIEQTGERPDYRELDELANWIIFGTKGLSLRKRNEVKALKEDA